MRDQRRSFLKALAAAPAALTARGARAAPAQSVAAGPAPAARSGYDAVAEALAEAVRREHGPHLDAAALEAVRKEIARSLESAARLRSAVRLGNADEPVTPFSARGGR